MGCGDIANEQGDICFHPGHPPISEGRLSLPFDQAFRALSHGWRWKAADDDDGTIHVQRGGAHWRSRRAA